MELLLNLCWLSLLLPAFLLWRQRTCSTGSDRPAVFFCALGCAMILLFPVISATDDLHAMRPEMEESERAFRHAGHCACVVHALTHSSQPDLPSCASVMPAFEQIGTVLPFMPPTFRVFSEPEIAGRAPPLASPTAL